LLLKGIISGLFSGFFGESSLLGFDTQHGIRSSPAIIIKLDIRIFIPLIIRLCCSSVSRI